MIGTVEKKIADKFLVNSNLYIARGQLKGQGIFVGDKVEVDEDKKVISKVLSRKNLLIRPPLANVDKMIIVLAPVPKPDFLLMDKLIVFCEINDIEPVLCVNKSDILNDELKLNIKRIYHNVLPIIFASAQNGDIENLRQQIKGLCAFAGQSAVGKSSLINALHGKDVEEVGSLSKRTDRGKQTTRIVSLYNLGSGYIADTAGFSKLDEKRFHIKKLDLAGKFKEFLPYLKNCYYSSCSHVKDDRCAIKKAVAEGKISEERYQNYVKIYESLSEVKNYEKKN